MMRKFRREGDLMPRKALTIAEYASIAHQTDRFKDDPNALSRLRFGFFGEIGGLLSSIKRVNRDTLHQTERQFALEELGDAMWYLLAYAKQRGVEPAQVAIECWIDLRIRLGEAKKSAGKWISFRQIDGLLAAQLDPESDPGSSLLGELAYIAGDLARAKVENRSPNKNIPLKLGRVLSHLAIVTATFGLRLEDVARFNIEKILSRWPTEPKKWTPLFDAGEEIPEHERLPRNFRVRFDERDGNSAKPYVVQSISKIFVGDRLTDNNEIEDGYRFHDVFHLAYVAYLGWSPVIRALLKRKRKSDPIIDENQDGARAMIIEEGIATWIFNHAVTKDLYVDVAVGKLDYSLLKQIRSMVDGYEVDACPLWQWELAIINGFSVFRELYKARCGTIVVDMTNHTLKFEKDKNKS